MTDKSIDWNALQRTAMINLIQDMKEWNDLRLKSAIAGSLIFKTNKMKQFGIEPDKITEMISNTALDEFGSNVFTQSLLELLDILDYDEPDPETVKFFYDNLQQAYYFGFQRDQKKATRIFYDNLKAAAQNSIKIDTVAMPSKTVFRQLRRLKKQQQDIEQEGN
jgi:hypothetical protein